MKPVICCGISDFKEFSFKDYPFGGYEFKSNAPGFQPNSLILVNLKETFRGKDLSMHSQLSRIFSCRERGIPEFADAEMDILRSEIIIAKIIGIKELNFHMKEAELSKDEIKKFNDIINFAKKQNIEMIYENYVCSDETILRILKIFPKLNFCLDIGHLNIAIHSGKFNVDLDEFIDKVKSRLVNIHVHNNNGEKDSHKYLGDGNFSWRDLLDKLKEGNLRKIIIENRTKKDRIKSKKLLEKYLSTWK